MKVRFLGPIDKITGSCSWLQDETRGWNFLVDCGLQQGEADAGTWNRGDWPFEPAALKFVVLTHAHIDHCGLLPLLYKKGFTGRVICTRETAQLSKLLLEDAARQADAPYGIQDVQHVIWSEPTGRPAVGGCGPVDTDLFLQFFRSGHVVGACSVAVMWGPKGDTQRSIVFSGDVGPLTDLEHLPLLRFRMNPSECQFAVLESTYGATVRTPEAQAGEARLNRLRELLDETVAQDGVLLLPAFSLGRTQDLLFDLHLIVAEDPERYDALEFLLDAPLAMRMHPVLVEAFDSSAVVPKSGKLRPHWLGKQVFKALGLDDGQADHINAAVRAIQAALPGRTAGPAFQELAVGNDVARCWRPLIIHEGKLKPEDRGPGQRPRVVVTGSGTCDGGPILAWLPALLDRPSTTVAMTGYVPPSSVGGRLLELAKLAPAERARDHRSLALPGVAQGIAHRSIQAHITNLTGYSAHADQNGLLDWMFWQHDGRPMQAAKQMVFIQHGNATARAGLAAAIKERARDTGRQVQVSLPGPDSDWFDLERDGRELDRATELERVQAEIQRLQAQAKSLDSSTSPDDPAA